MFSTGDCSAPSMDFLLSVTHMYFLLLPVCVQVALRDLKSPVILQVGTSVSMSLHLFEQISRAISLGLVLGVSKWRCPPASVAHVSQPASGWRDQDHVQGPDLLEGLYTEDS